MLRTVTGVVRAAVAATTATAVVVAADQILDVLSSISIMILV